jgi:hypothetical protein
VGAPLLLFINGGEFVDPRMIDSMTNPYYDVVQRGHGRGDVVPYEVRTVSFESRAPRDPEQDHREF